ncbi:MAG: hypothetical protein AAGN82_04495 [Myxococcota bacterium]
MAGWFLAVLMAVAAAMLWGLSSPGAPVGRLVLRYAAAGVFFASCAYLVDFVERRRWVPRPPEWLPARPSAPREPGGPFRRSAEVRTEPSLPVPAGPSWFVGTIHRLADMPGRDDVFEPWRGLATDRAMVAGISFTCRAARAWRAEVWVAESVVVDRERNACVLYFSTPGQGDARRRDPFARRSPSPAPLWVGAARLGRALRAMKPPSNALQAIGEGDGVCLKVTPTLTDPDSRLARPVIERRVGTVADIRYHDLSKHALELWTDDDTVDRPRASTTDGGRSTKRGATANGSAAEGGGAAT